MKKEIKDIEWCQVFICFMILLNMIMTFIATEVILEELNDFKDLYIMNWQSNN